MAINIELQRKLLKAFIINKQFLNYILYIDNDFWSNDLHKKVYKIIKRYVEVYKQNISEAVLKNELGDLNAIEEKELSNILSLEIVEWDYLKEEIEHFIIFNRLKDSIYKSVEILKKEKKEDYEKIRNMFDEAMKVNFSSKGYDYFEAENIKRRLEEKVELNRIPTGIKALDVMLGGGLGKGEMGVVAGITGFGKTMVLQNFAVSAVLMGKNVVYYTFEILEEDLARRFDKIFTEMSDIEIKNRQKEVIEKLDMIKKNKGSLIIKYYDMYTLTPIGLKNDLMNLFYQGHNIDVVIVDYGQRLRSVVYADRWQELIYIYDMLASIALDLKVCMWSAIQLVKQAMSKEIPDLMHISGAKDIMNAVDIGIGIAQSIEEREKGELRFFIMKARRINARKVIKCKVSYDNMLIRSYKSENVESKSVKDEQKQNTEDYVFENKDDDF